MTDTSNAARSPRWPRGAVVSKTSFANGSPRSSIAGRSGSAAKRSPRCGTRWTGWWAAPGHGCPRGLSRFLAAGGPRCARRPRCPSTRWCCTAAGSPTAA